MVNHLPEVRLQMWNLPAAYVTVVSQGRLWLVAPFAVTLTLQPHQFIALCNCHTLRHSMYCVMLAVNCMVLKSVHTLTG